MIRSLLRPPKKTRLWRGPLIMLAGLALAAIFTRTIAPSHVPGFYVLPFIRVMSLYATFVGGWRSGLMCLVIELAQFGVTWFEPGRPPRPPEDALQFLLVISLSNLATILMFEAYKWHSKRLLEVELERNLAVAHAEEVKRVNQELLEIDRLKDEFLSVVSHELRTPLTSIRGFTQMLGSDKTGRLNEKQHRCVERIESNGQRMHRLVNDLLDFAKIHAGSFSVAPEQVRYRPLVEEVVTLLHPMADEKRLEIEIDVQAPAAVSLDGHRIAQVITNLVGNSIKFTPAGGRIRIEAYTRGDELVTEVADTGSGIAAEDIPKVFKPFVQLDMSSTRKASGTGIGLSICKAIVEAHGGTIGLRSVLGAGTTFYFTLPALSSCDDRPPSLLSSHDGG